MAGDWIKMRASLHTHPKIVRMASALHADRLKIVGGLHAVWCLFDVHSEDGNLDGYTPEALDELIGFPGFSNALREIGWLESKGDHLVLPRFEEHNGQSAKRRAQETQRKRCVRKMSAFDADKNGTREEKRREEKELHSPSVDAGLDCPYEDVVSLYAEVLPELAQPRMKTDKRVRALRSRWREQAKLRAWKSVDDGVSWFKTFFEQVRRYPHLMGRNDRNWQADFDWIMQPDRFAQIIEGKWPQQEEIAA